MRLEPRSEVSPIRFILAPIVAIISSLLLCSGLILWSGASVFEAYWMMLSGSIGSAFALAETLSRATPLIFTGLAAACLLYTSPSPRDQRGSRMPSSA